MTPLKAIRKICVECVGSFQEVIDCGGDKCLGDQGDENNVCFFYPYRMGKGRPSVKLIRKFCLECMGGSKSLVSKCEKPNCPLHKYRHGRNPKRAGIGNKNAIPPTVRSKIGSQKRVFSVESSSIDPGYKNGE